MEAGAGTREISQPQPFSSARTSDHRGPWGGWGEGVAQRVESPGALLRQEVLTFELECFLLPVLSWSAVGTLGQAA